MHESCQQSTTDSGAASNSQNQQRIVGYSVKNKDSLAVYVCQICLLLLRYPCQLPCGHRCCRSCIEQRPRVFMECSRCHTEIEHDKIMIDQGCRLDMENLNIVCFWCEWNGPFKNYDKHLSENHANPYCQYCGQEYKTINDLTKHQFTCESNSIGFCLEQDAFDEQVSPGRQDNSINNQSMMHLEQKDHTCSSTIDVAQIMDRSQLSGTIATLLDSVEVLGDEIQNTNTELLKQENVVNAVGKSLLTINRAKQETTELIETQKRNGQILEQSMVSLQQEISVQKNTSYDGTMIWKITDFQQKIVDAQAERQTSIYSPIFYSSPTGYKMCCRLYPFGDGTARGTHLSLFFVLMRGEYDNIISFPFDFKVTFILFDQTDQQRHVIDSFRPDTKSNSFQRPRSSMNIASGIPRFLPLSMVQARDSAYVRDDIMFIKVMVNLESMPKTLLPYVSTLNPALPSLIQREAIQKEIERRSKSKSSQSNVEGSSCAMHE